MLAKTTVHSSFPRPMMPRCFRISIFLMALVCSGRLVDAAEPATKVAFKELKLSLKQGESFDRQKHIPESISRLEGTPIEIRGFVHPGSVFATTGLKEFVIVDDGFVHNFVAKIDEVIVVQLAAGEATNFTTKRLKLSGTFRIQEFKSPDGTVLAIYKLEAATQK